MTFTPTKDFWSDEMQSMYCKDLQYVVRPGNAKLQRLAEDWVRKGTCRVVSNARVVISNAPAPAPNWWERLMSWL
jgi:accessory colonization factor AcfC